ncbi:MAG: YiiD C-terminal domain-containing protein [Wenzhouxiangella sp.]|jgi:thioesterase domain-containing protein|nr:YiiD C-terminal domain-containing protein [Wenzhouxiangella sp.]
MDDLSERDWLAGVLTADIPLGGAMALTVERLDEQRLVLGLPLEPNVNDKGTAFGGALVSAMILAGWSLPRLLLRRAGLAADLVIGRAETRFLEPVEGAFVAVCDWPEPASRETFVDELRARGRGRLALEPRIECRGRVAATLSARYAALNRE